MVLGEVITDHLIPAFDAAPFCRHLDLLTSIISQFLAADLARMAVGLFITLALTVCNSLWDELTNSDSFYGFERFFSAVSSVTSVLEVFQRYALHKFVFYLFYFYLLIK